MMEILRNWYSTVASFFSRFYAGAVGKALLDWIMITVGLLLLLLFTGCFESTLALAEKNLRKVKKVLHEYTPRTDRKGRIRLKKVMNGAVARRLLKLTERSERYVLAYYYDNSTAFSNKEIITNIHKLSNSIDAMRNPKLIENEKALLKVMNNATALCEDTLNLLSCVPHFLYRRK
jgi:hypothetical protein